jgi:FkbM family methyltransferase
VRYYPLMARGRIAIGAIVVAAAALLVAAGSDGVAAYWTDATSALSWENPYCTYLAAFRGLVKARTVEARTGEILHASRMVGEDDQGLFLYETPEGDFWLPQRDDVWSLAVVLAEQEQEMYGHEGTLGVRPGDVVIDGGAHVGLFTRTALAAGASKVVTFEVTPKALLCLRRNLAKEIAEGKVVVVDKGVWHEEATLPLVIVDGCSVCNSVTHQMPAAVDVPLTTIDHAAEALKLARVDFIKLDIENAEANALRGAAQTLRRFHPRVAVALENAKNRYEYADEVLGIMHDAFSGYAYECGACTNPEPSRRVLPEILHFYPR